MHANDTSPPIGREPLAPPPRWRHRRHVSALSLLVLLLLGLGVLLVLGASAPTRPATPPASPAPQEPMKEAAMARPDGAALLTLKAGDIPLLHSIQSRQLLLSERENNVAERDKQLAAREAALRLVQQQIEEKLTLLTTLRQEMGEVLQEQATFEEKRFEHLVKVYDAMKPTEVSSLVSRLNEETAVRLLYQMKEKKAGQVLAALPPDVAATLSERLAVYRQRAAQTAPAKEKP